LRYGELKVEYDTEVTSGVRWSNRDIGRHEKSMIRDFRKLFGRPISKNSV